MRRVVVFLLSVALAFGSIEASTPSAQAAGPVTWPTYLMDNAHDGYNASETTITPSTAPNLKLHWYYQGSKTISTQPVAANNLIYSGSWDGYEYAFCASGTCTTPTGTSVATGQIVWQTYLGRVLETTNDCYPPAVGVASTGAIATLTISGSQHSALLIAGGGNLDASGNALANPQAQMYALDAITGQVLWTTDLGPYPGNFMWSSPAYYNGSAYVGVASFGDCPLVQGKVVKLDATTGAVQATFNTVPDTCTGGGVWGSPTIDNAAGTLYIATGNPGPCGSAEPYAEAVVELRTSDLSPVGSWQVPSNSQVSDGDFGSTPTLFSGKVRGRTTPLVGIANKNGTYYAFQRDRISAGPVWQQKVAIPASSPEDGIGSSISPSAFDGTSLYIAGGATTAGGTNCGGSVRAVNPGSGAVKWQICLPGAVLGALTVVPGVVAFSQQSTSGTGMTVELVRSSNGSLLFSYPPAGANFYGAPSIVNGVLYFGDVSGELYAIGT